MSKAQPTTRLHQSVLRRAGLGRLFYLGYHIPWKHLRECRRVGLQAHLRRMISGPRMRAAARRLGPLPDLPPAPRDWPIIRFLTGQNFWQQTVFCARSLELAAGHNCRFEIHDDGTLNEPIRRSLSQLFPGAIIGDAATAAEAVHSMLPPSKYPALHSVRRLCKYQRKLFDLRSLRSDWSLYLDSDMLFHSRPDELIEWMKSPASGRFLHDRIESYCPPADELTQIVGAPIARNVNAGLLACHDRDVDWDFLEWFTHRVPENSRSDRAFEQTLSALFMSRIPDSRPLDPERYRVIYDEFTSPPDSALIHYCWDSNLVYREREWMRVVKLHRQHLALTAP